MHITPENSPAQIFAAWMDEARSHPHVREANAMTLATLGENGEPHARVVLCKSWEDANFTFYTNYESQKGRELARTPRAAAVFYWDALFRQVKLSGSVLPVPRAQSEAYWRSRARGSQLSQLVSKQSAVATSFAEIEGARAEAAAAVGDRVIPCPSHWGGFRIETLAIEFWVGRPDRLHERHQFVRPSVESAWAHQILYP